MKRIVVFSTSDIQQYNRRQVLESTGALEKALRWDFTVYVVTTRTLFGETDRWWNKLVPHENILTANGDYDCFACNSPGLIDPWIKLYERLGIPLPVKDRDLDDEEFLQDTLEGPLPQLRGFNSWLQARELLDEASFPDKVVMSGITFSKRIARQNPHHL